MPEETAPLRDEMLTPEINYTVPRGFARRATIATTRTLFSPAPAMVILVIVLSALLVVLRFPYWWIPIPVVSLYLVAMVVVARGQYRATEERFPVGTVLSARFGAESFWESSPLGEAVTRYDAFSRVRVHNGFLVFTGRRGWRQTANMIPIELVPGADWLAHIRRSVG